VKENYAEEGFLSQWQFIF